MVAFRYGKKPITLDEYIKMKEELNKTSELTEEERKRLEETTDSISGDNTSD